MPTDPEHGVVVHEDRMVPARDGVRLATDVYRPADPGTGEAVPDPRPALLLRTPYNKRRRDLAEEHGRWFARRGYVVALQDVRGRFASEGDFYLLANEAEDGADAVEWLAARPYCDGQVGTMGTSYMAWVQTALATQDPSGLAAMFVNQGAASAWEATLRHNGAFELRWLCWALTVGGGFAHRALDDPDVQRALAAVDVRDVLAADPVTRGGSPLRHVPGYEDWVFDLATAPGDDPLWARPSLDFLGHIERMADVPTVLAGSWYDSYAKATCDTFVARADHARSDQFLLMGAWTHGGQSAWTAPHAGEAGLGPALPRDYLETQLAFFDHYLRGRGTWADRPTVEYFLMGTGDGVRGPDGRLRYGGEWHAGDEWPLPDTAFTPYYAHADGTLSTDPPAAAESRSTYTFDPRDPVPTIGGNCSSYNTFTSQSEPIETLPLADRPRISITGRGGYDQRTRPDTFGAEPPYRPLAERGDVLTFRTPPLEAPVAIAGPIRVTVHGSTDAPDTDFTAKLVDEHPPSQSYPEGFALNLADSICRARYRGYRRSPDPVEPGRIYALEMESYPTATVFGAGHRIRLDVSSSNYPRFDVNHNTGDPPLGDREFRIATNAVHHDRDHPTRVVLPVRPDAAP